ncbi:MAG: sodium:proton antiporter [Pseudorhodobacter sp.]|nr:sodium:proton antiporter [Pseudorhodobacter sp.]
MTEILAVGVIALLLIAAASVLGPRLRIESPLVLVAIGFAASFLPLFHATEIEPELILEGVLPPLLYSSAVSMPAMNFRREFGAISGLSVLLVIGTSLLLGVFFQYALPDLGFAWGVALGAIISPTDAVAVSIIKQTTVSKRAVAILDGESLLNDASALVMLRTAIAATAASFSVWSAAGSFLYSVVVAVIIGLLVGWLNLLIRKRVTDPTVNTVISFAVPFIASIPAGLLGASGLVAAVFAGLFTGFRAPRDLSPQNRLSDSQNWRTIELVLEGAVFLMMGVQIREIWLSVAETPSGVTTPLLIAAGALAVTILVRTAFVTPLLGVLAASVRRQAMLQPQMLDMQEKMATPQGKQELFQQTKTGWLSRSEHQIEAFAQRVTQGLADIKYFRRMPLGWREGTVVVWAGMRGAVTIAAAQTLPADTPQRPVLVLIAFAVAVLSLLLQGGTIGLLLRLIMPKAEQAATDADEAAERARLGDLLRETAEGVGEPPPDTPGKGALATIHHRLAVLAHQRAALLDARDNGAFDADVLADALANLDAAHIAIAMRVERG